MKRGDIVNLGPHRLMCGDCGDQSDVSSLINNQADMVFTSPPYLNQRLYKGKTSCWESMMNKAFGTGVFSPLCQIIVNLGMVHHDSEWMPYWNGWLDTMRAGGWRRYGLYVWDKSTGMCGDYHGRLSPSFEFLFHLNKKTRRPNKTVPCLGFGKRYLHGSSPLGRDRKSARRPHNHTGKPVNRFKIDRDVISVNRDKANKTGHPAVFPSALAFRMVNSYTSPKDTVYDPFGGSGTIILACQEAGRIACVMEIEPDYCDMAVERYRRHIEKINAPSKPKRKVVSA